MSKTVFEQMISLKRAKKDLLNARGVLPGKRLLGMCRWMGLHFHKWIDYNEVTFLIQSNTRMGSHIFGISGVRKFW